MKLRNVSMLGWLLTAGLTAAGCGESLDPPVTAPSGAPEAVLAPATAPSPSVEPAELMARPGVEHFVSEGEEIFYLRSRHGVMTLEADEAFEHVDIHATLTEFELRALDASGEVVLGWTRITAAEDDANPAAIERSLTLAHPAQTLEYRATTPVEFVRLAVGSGDPHLHEGDEPHPEGATTVRVSKPGRWVPPDDVLAIANTQYNPYSGAPTSCSGSLRAGTREVAEFLKREFEGATSYGGYACRVNTANTSQYSVHASGRAIDLFVPLHAGDADNDLGDPIAHYLIMNAENLGIEFVVWDRTSWGAHRTAPKHRAYTGPHPHHDHLHIELSPASSGRTGRTFPPINRDAPPIGYLDGVDCETGIHGWSQDPDAPDRPVEVYISIGGPVFTEGAAGYFVPAATRRDDLCTAIGSCDHAYRLPIPRGLMDGQPRAVHVYGMDATGGPENTELTNSGMMLQCDRPALPFGADYGIRRHIPSGEVLTAWQFDRNDIVRYDDSELGALPQLASLPAAPALARLEGAPEVYLVEPGVRRHVPNGETMNTWKFDWDAITPLTTVDDLILSAPVEPRPFLAQGSGPEVYVIEPPPALWADEIAWSTPPRIGRGQTAPLELTIRNRGSRNWEPELFELRPTPATTCDDCVGALDAALAPTESATLRLHVTAPDTVGTTEACFELLHDGFEFGSTGQGGPAEAICTTFEVVTDPVVLEPATNPGSTPGVHAEDEDGLRVIEARGGCSTAPATPATPWLVMITALALGLIRRRTR